MAKQLVTAPVQHIVEPVRRELSTWDIAVEEPVSWRRERPDWTPLQHALWRAVQSASDAWYELEHTQDEEKRAGMSAATLNDLDEMAMAMYAAYKALDTRVLAYMPAQLLAPAE